MNASYTALAVGAVATVVWYMYLESTRKPDEPPVDNTQSLLLCFVGVSVATYMLVTMMDTDNKTTMMKYIDQGDPDF